MLKQRIADCRSRALQFYTTTLAVAQSFGVKKSSTFHNIQEYPHMLLPATYNATNALTLLGAYDELSEEQRQKIADFIHSYQREDGIFHIIGTCDKDVYKKQSIEATWEYIDFYISNNCLAALRGINQQAKYPLQFVDKYTCSEFLSTWLQQRDMSKPWCEGNSMVNLASFFEVRGQRDFLQNMISWLNDHQDAETGLWGTSLRGKDLSSHLHAIAGAAQNFHIFYLLNEPIHHTQKIIDTSIAFAKNGLHNASVDAGIVDILVNMLAYNYRADEIIALLKKLLVELLDWQNDDGGFPDMLHGIRRMDGWVNGYWEPQGMSNSFATWLRLAAIAMIDGALHPQNREQWKFGDTIGVGYINWNYLCEHPKSHSKMDRDYDHILNIDYDHEFCQTTLPGDTFITTASRTTQKLDGKWQYAIDVYDTGIRKKFYEEVDCDEEGRKLPVDFDFEDWEDIMLPQNWNVHKPELLYYEGTVLFVRNFRYSSMGRNSSVLGTRISQPRYISMRTKSTHRINASRSKSRVSSDLGNRQ